jgi:hypothetical protein
MSLVADYVRSRKQTVVTRFKVLFRHSPVEAGENHENVESGALYGHEKSATL